MIDALGNVIALLVVGDQHRAALVIDAIFGVVVTDALERIARHLDVVDMGVGGDFTSQHDQPGIGQRFGCHTGSWVLFEDCVENRIRDLIGHLVRVTLGN